jgi:hypothetical protein
VIDMSAITDKYTESLETQRELLRKELPEGFKDLWLGYGKPKQRNGARSK